MADVTAAEASDPLSDEVIVVYPHAKKSRALAPPSAGVQGKGFRMVPGVRSSGLPVSLAVTRTI